MASPSHFAPLATKGFFEKCRKHLWNHFAGVVMRRVPLWKVRLRWPAFALATAGHSSPQAGQGGRNENILDCSDNHLIGRWYPTRPDESKTANHSRCRSTHLAVAPPAKLGPL